LKKIADSETIKKMTIKRQIFLAMIGVTMISIVILGTASFGISKRTIERNFQKAHMNSLEVAGSIIDIQLNSIVELSRTLLINDSFMKVMSDASAERTPYFDSSQNLTLDHAFRNLTTQNNYIESIVAVSRSGSIRFYTLLSNQSGKMSHYYADQSILKGNWIADTDEAKGREVFFSRNILFDDNNTTFSMTKRLINPGSGEFEGYLIVNIRKELLESAFGNEEENYSSDRICIVDSGKKAYRDGSRDAVVYYEGSDEKEDQMLTMITTGADGGFLISSVDNDVSGWKIVNAVDRKELSRDSSYIGWLMLTIGTVMVAASAFLSSIISRAITSPLDQLENTINQVGDGNYRVETDFDDSETGKIGTHFKNMVNNNLELHDRLLQMEIKEKDAELLLLQSQINPHFLYNTLDSLYFMAVIDRADDIAEMVQALSEMFRLSLNKGDKLISVENEISNITAYMKIQNMRFHDRFAFTVILDEAMKKEKMLSFILQPLVENAVTHGLEPQIGEGKIEVSGMLKDQTMTFCVADSGVGIRDMKKLDEGYGVNNVRERIRLYYGDAYKVCFESRPGEGTKVTLTIPIIQDRKEQEI
jgi:two-component system sensor histidine kinase YesM